jgi:hypothetical protein
VRQGFAAGSLPVTATSRPPYVAVLINSIHNHKFLITRFQKARYQANFIKIKYTMHVDERRNWVMKKRTKYLWNVAITLFLLIMASSQTFGSMNILLEDGRVITVPVNKNEVMGIMFDRTSVGVSGQAASSAIPVTLYWHMADDADVYLNGVPLRRYEPSFRTRGDEAPLPAFSASATLKNGDVFTVGGRRGGSYGFMLIAVDLTGRVVFKTDQQSWKVYRPGERNDWYQPGVAGSSPQVPVTVQPDPWYPQKELNKKHGNQALSIWGAPAETFCCLTATVSF